MGLPTRNTHLVPFSSGEAQAFKSTPEDPKVLHRTRVERHGLFCVVYVDTVRLKSDSNKGKQDGWTGMLNSGGKTKTKTHL